MGTLALTKSSNFAVHDCSSQHDLQVMLGLAVTAIPAFCSRELHDPCCRHYQ